MTSFLVKTLLSCYEGLSPFEPSILAGFNEFSVFAFSLGELFGFLVCSAVIGLMRLLFLLFKHPLAHSLSFRGVGLQLTA